MCSREIVHEAARRITKEIVILVFLRAASRSIFSDSVASPASRCAEDSEDIGRCYRGAQRHNPIVPSLLLVARALPSAEKITEVTSSL